MCLYLDIDPLSGSPLVSGLGGGGGGDWSLVALWFKQASEGHNLEVMGLNTG